MSAKPILPSAVFLAIVPDDGRTLQVEHLKKIIHMVDGGLWPFDPHEVDPRTGWNYVHALTRSSMMDEGARNLALQWVVSKGADVNFKDEKGQTAWQWLSGPESSFLRTDQMASLERLGAEVPEQSLSAIQKEVVDALRNLEHTWLTTERLIQKALGPGGFESLDATFKGVPLGLQTAWMSLRVNGADLISPSSPGTTEKLKALDAWMDSLSRLGKQALKVEPQGGFALWCWMSQSQIIKWSSQNVTPARKKRWEGRWTSLERALVRTRYQGMPAPLAQRQLALDATELVRQVMGSIAYSSSTPHQKRLQPLAAYLLTGLRAWVDRTSDLEDGEPGHMVSRARRKALWDAATCVARQVPTERWQKEEFTQDWSSASYYALRKDVDDALRNGQGLPDFIEHPWLTLPAIIQHPDHETEQDMALLERWLLDSPPTRSEKQVGLGMLLHNPSVVAQLSSHLLDASLSSAPSPSTSPRVRL